MKWNRPQILFTLLTVAVLFSVQFPLPMVDSNYASLNLSDLVILCIFVHFLSELFLDRDWHVSLTMPHLTSLFVLTSVWILITTSVAVFRSPVPVVANILWTLKWLEIVALLILVQQYAEEVDWQTIVKIVVAGAALIAAISIAFSLTSTGWSRATVLWRNPNTLAVFLALPSLICFVYAATSLDKNLTNRAAALFVGFILILGIGGTGSRSGLITLIVGTVVALLLAYRQISTRILLGGMSVGVMMGLGGLWLTGRMKLFQRFFPTVAIRDGGIVVSGTGSAGIDSRVRLTKKGIDLWLDQPIFGYGWFASPENPLVGFLDVFYTQILVDVGIVGFVLVMLLYLEIFRQFARRSNGPSIIVSVAGAGWVLGLLAAGIGGAHARVPRIMFIMILLLAAVLHRKIEDRNTKHTTNINN